MPIQVARSARANYSVTSYIGDRGQIFWDEALGEIKLSDGVTPGGLSLSSGSVDFQQYLNSVQGNILPDQDSLRDLGSPEKQWRDLYLSGNSLFIAGTRISVENDQLVLPANTIIRNQQVSSFSGDYEDLTNKPDLSQFQLSANAFSGDYNDLTNKPDSFGGDYNQLINKPTIPTNTNQLINGSGFITLGNLTGYATQAFVTSRGYLTSISWNDIQSKPALSEPISVGLINSQNNLGITISDISTLRFDSDSGFDVTDLGNGAVKIAMNSTFKTWKVDGQDDLIATGLDTIEFEAGQGITITTDPLASPNKKITFSGFSGDYDDLTNTPDLSVYQLSANAFGGDYDDLTNKPAIPGDIAELTDANNLLFSGDYIDLTNRPDLSVYQLSANAFSGDYDDLTNKPAIPTNTNQLTNGAGFITNSALSGFATQAFVTSRGYLTSVSYGIITDKPNLSVVATTGSYADLINLPILFSGDYDDLINKPTIPSDTGDLTNSAGFITSAALTGYATETYVDQAISDVVGAAPEVLDTLKELSDALGNDADFASNITASLSSKANTADLDPVAFSGDYRDLSNQPDVPTDISDLTDEQGRLAAAYSFSIAADDSTQRVVSNNETVKISGTNGVTTSSDDEGNITVSGPALSAVAASGDYDDLTNKPAIPSDIGDLADANDLLFSGDYGDLSNTPSIPQNLNDLADVDVATNPPQFGQVLKYNGEKWGPAADQGSIDPNTGGVVTDASTLNGFDGTYYLNYNNLNNKPAPYELPPATTETLGGVRIGENITVTNGTISVPKGAGINKVVDIPDVYDDNGLENKYILRYNSGATRWETEDLDLSNSTMDGGFY